MIRVVFAGGGTGGHVYPALAVADELGRMRPEILVTFVGTRNRIESRIVPERGYDFRTISISGLRRTISLEGLVFPVRLAVALVQSFVLLLRLRPAVVVGTGGFVSGPPVAAAWLLGRPTLLQEQNSYPGVTTRLLSRVATEVHVTFEGTRRFLSRQDTIRVTGTPVRAEIGTVVRAEAAARLGMDRAAPTVLVLGGSQGAASINDAVLAVLPGLLRRGAQVIWAAGRAEFARVEEQIRRSHADRDARLRVVPYIERMEDAYAVADVAVARAGLPAVLVPYPHAAADHQTANARAVVDAGAALMIADDAVARELGEVLDGLLEDAARRDAMHRAARALARPDAARQLAAAVLHLAGEDR